MRILEYMSHLASNSTAALDPSTCTGNLLQCLGFKIISIVESALILAIYTLTMVYVLYHVGWSLDKSAYVTMLVFFIAELASLILYIFNATGTNETGGIPVILA